jgi:hypothetical protein
MIAWNRDCFIKYLVESGQARNQFNNWFIICEYYRWSAKKFNTNFTVLWYTQMVYTQFLNKYFVILDPSFAFMFIYCKLLYSIKFSLYWKVYQTNIIDITDFYILCHVTTLQLLIH